MSREAIPIGPFVRAAEPCGALPAEHERKISGGACRWAARVGHRETAPRGAPMASRVIAAQEGAPWR